MNRFLGESEQAGNKKDSAIFENQTSDICKAYYYVRANCILSAQTGVKKISSAVCGISSFKIHYSVNRINEVYVFQ